MPAYIGVYLSENPAYNFVSFVPSYNLIQPQLHNQESSDVISNPRSIKEAGGTNATNDVQWWFSGLSKIYEKTEDSGSGTSSALKIMHGIANKPRVPPRLKKEPEYQVLRQMFEGTQTFRASTQHSGHEGNELYSFQNSITGLFDGMIDYIKSIQEHHLRSMSDSLGNKPHLHLTDYHS
jgi:hypothetical protein